MIMKYILNDVIIFFCVITILEFYNKKITVKFKKLIYIKCEELICSINDYHLNNFYLTLRIIIKQFDFYEGRVHTI